MSVQLAIPNMSACDHAAYAPNSKFIPVYQICTAWDGSKW